MKDETPITTIETIKYCPFGDYDCLKEECAWWVTDQGEEECAIVKLAKGVSR